MNLSEYKDVIKFAMANEVEAQKFYADAAEKLQKPGPEKNVQPVCRGGEKAP